MKEKAVAADHVNVGDMLAILWSLLTPKEQSLFWEYSRVYARDLNHKKQVYKQLCVSLKELELNKKLLAVGSSVRDLSADDLRKQIGRYKERLLPLANARPFLVGALCTWIQSVKLQALNAVLDSLECPHNKSGILTGGTIPFHTPAEANARIGQLTKSFSAHDLAIVCAGLMLSNPHWQQILPHTLDSMRQRESNEVAIPSLMPTFSMMPSKNAVSAVSNADNAADNYIDINQIHAIRKGLDSLSAKLSEACAEIEAGRLPMSDASTNIWHEVTKNFIRAAEALSVTTFSVDDLDTALAARNRSKFHSTLERCRNIQHKTDSTYAGRAIIVQKCDELEQALTESNVGFHSELAFKALIRLIEENDILGDEAVANLQSEVESAFGAIVAIAAVRGKLHFNQAESAPNPVDQFPTEDAKSAPFEAPVDAPEQELKLQAANSVDEDQISIDVDHHENLSDFSETQKTGLVVTHSSMEAGIDEAQAMSSEIEKKDLEIPAPSSPDGDIVAAVRSPRSEFLTFENFCKVHWVDSNGVVVPVPWTTSEISSELEKLSLEAWREGKPAIAYLFARAVNTYESKVILDLDDLASADQLLLDPLLTNNGRDPNRAGRLRKALTLPPPPISPTFGLALMLEALRPTLPCMFTLEEIDSLVERTSYNDPALSEVVSFLLNGWVAQINPIETLRAKLVDEPEETVEELISSLQVAQAALKTEVATLWSAGGGKIQRTHCRAAWTKFVQKEVAPLRDELAPEKPKAGVHPTLSRSMIGMRVIDLGRSYKRIMDAANVKHADRSAADGAAEKIVSAIDRVAIALDKILTRQQRGPSSYQGIPHEAGSRLLSGSSSTTTDQLCASLFTAVICKTPQASILRIKAGYLITHIDAVRYLRPDTLTQPGIAFRGVCVRQFEDPVPVSLMLRKDWQLDEPQQIEDDNSLLSSLRNIAAETGRRDILAALSATEILQSHERTLLHRFALELQDEAFEVTQQLEKIWGACNELMSSVEPSLKAIVDNAKSLAGVAAHTSITKSLLLLTWLKKTVETAVSHRDVAVEALLKVADERSKELSRRIQDYFNLDDYRSGVALFHTGDVPKIGGDRLAGRRTIWRDDAVRRWTEPRAKLANDFQGSNSDMVLLTSTWISNVLDSSQWDSLPKLFYTVISGEAGRSTNENQKRFPVKLASLREHRDRKTFIFCEPVRNYFQKSKLNPTFLPQLADFSRFVIVSSPHRNSYGSSMLDDWSKVASSETAGSFVVFLAPGIPTPRRDDISAGLRKRGISAAIIDDIDLCRLYAASSLADGHDFVPFLEVLFEQLDLDRASPFSSLDGQHVRLETYIGRTYEAQKVALGGTYTRVFSGRKLGKSALLKYVASTFDGFELPSGKELSVFFITIAGGESERWVVDCIIGEMAARFGLQEVDTFKERPPAERFSSFMLNFLNEKPNHSVLLILDEADAFVEGQLARYDTDREGSLSFRMMKELTAQVDSNQLPRVRTIFSGYRVTNTRGGVWANAGDVLVLRPLAEEEAALFLQGMLARIGISLGNHAPFVAMRCGFQPAVLIRFGENLVKRLKRVTRSANRETLSVTHEEVLATLADPGVLDEIKTVVNNNFQGNRIGAVIFGATLLALKDLEPGLALTDGPAQVLAKLHEVDSNLDWLERIDASPLAEIERNLRDFIDRELLTVSDARQFGVREYRLRFPHFLPVLTQQSEIALEVRRQIQSIRGGASQRRVAESVLSENALDTVRFWYSKEDVEYCKLIVVSGHWMSALINDKCGIPDRLGCESAAFSSSNDAKPAQTLLNGRGKVFGNVRDEDWPVFLETAMERPAVLIGGIDLQRTASKYALSGGEVPVEIVTLGRLTEATLAWWFEDARALHFKTTDAILRIADATDLVPFLADSFDQILPHSPGSDVSDDDLKSALRRLEEGIVEIAGKLSDGSSPDALTRREIELLKMAVQVTEGVVEEFDVESEFAVSWGLLNHSGDGLDAPFSLPDDWSSLRLLIDTGLLPQKIDAETVINNSRQLGKIRFRPKGMLVRLINALELSNAA